MRENFKRYKVLGKTKKHIGLVYSSCHRCYGSGRIGFHNGQPIPCNCIVLVKQPSLFDRLKRFLRKIFRATRPRIEVVA
jgi:hypothetical protein